MIVVEHVMGMPVLLDVRDGDPSREAIDRVWQWLRWVDATFSTFNEDSEISRLDRGELALDEAHPEVRGILAWCERLRDETYGFFDVRAAGGGLDPSGLVKGWAVDRAAEILAEAGFVDFALDAGGDIVLLGRPTPEPRWRVGIQHPYVVDKIAAVVEGTGLAVATSGEYQRGRHVFDPHTHAPPSGVLSVTVTGPDLATADAYATAAFAMGAEGPAWTASLPSGFDAMTITDDDRVLSTAGFPRAA